MFWVAVQQFDDALAHVVAENIVFEKVWYLVDIFFSFRQMQTVVGNILGDRRRWSSANQQLEDD